MKVSEQIKCVERELAIRRSAYPHFVEKGRMKKEQSEHEITAMESVLETLRAMLYLDTIEEDDYIRLDLQGRKNGKLIGVVKVFECVNNETLLLSFCRDNALEFWKRFSKE